MTKYKAHNQEGISKKAIYIFIAIFLVAILVVASFFIFNNSSSDKEVLDTPSVDLYNETSKAELVEADSIEKSDEFNNEDSLSKENPDKTETAKMFFSNDETRYIKLENQNKTIPLKNINTFEWLDNERILISSGKLNSVLPTNAGERIRVEVIGDKGIYIYNIETQEKTFLYGKEENKDTFSAIIKDGHIIISTNKTLEKLNLNGDYIKTLFKTESEQESIILTSQRNTPEGKIKISLRKDLDFEEVVLDLD